MRDLRAPPVRHFTETVRVPLLARVTRAVVALRSLGGRVDIRGRYRVSHVLVGVNGAAAGTAIERVGYARLTAALGYAAGQQRAKTRDFAPLRDPGP